jgi:hypothetical protein
VSCCEFHRTGGNELMACVHQPRDCCTWHSTGGSIVLACGDRNAQSFTVGHVTPAAGPLTLGVPLPGVNWQAECGAAREDRDRLAREVAQLERGRDRLQALCHAAAEERDDARAERDELTSTAWHAENARKMAIADGDRLRAVLAETPENVAAVAEALTHADEYVPAARAVLAALRVRAGITDLEAAVVNRGQREVGASAQPAGVAAAPTGQAGGAQSGSAGPPAGLDGWWNDPMCPVHPGQLCVAVAEHNGLCVYGCAIDNGHPPVSRE